MTTKIVALTDALGCLVRFELLPGQRFDTVGVPPLIGGVKFGGLIADKAFDSNSLIAELNERGAKVVISQHPRRAAPLQIDADIYKWRHLIDIDQSWRLSRIKGCVVGSAHRRWQSAPGRRRCPDRLEIGNRRSVGGDQRRRPGAGFDRSAG